MAMFGVSGFYMLPQCLLMPDAHLVDGLGLSLCAQTDLPSELAFIRPQAR